MSVPVRDLAIQLGLLKSGSINPSGLKSFLMDDVLPHALAGTVGGGVGGALSGDTSEGMRAGALLGLGAGSLKGALRRRIGINTATHENMPSTAPHADRKANLAEWLKYQKGAANAIDPLTTGLAAPVAGVIAATNKQNKQQYQQGY